jgi:serine protease AprX
VAVRIPRAGRPPRGAVTAASTAVAAVLAAGLLTTTAASAGLPALAAPPGLPAAGAHGHGGFLSGDWTPSSPPLNVTDVANTIGAVPVGGMDGTGIGVALVDTGVVNVPGLPSSQIVNGPDLSFESQGSTVKYLDTYGHGTHMAGIIVGSDSTVGLKGIAPKAKLTSIKVGTATGVVDVSQMIAALDWVVQHKNDDPKNPIRVVNLSYGTSSTQDALKDPMTFAVENAWRHGIVVVVAGGNAGNSSTSLDNPAYDPFVLTVGSAATKGTSSQSDDSVSTFTSVSSARKLDLVAPGESIVSLRDPGSYIDATYPTALVGTRLFKGSGSSQATAVVSAAVALLLQKKPTLTPDQVKAVLKASAVPVTGSVAASQGVKEINLAKALTASVPSNATQTFTPGSGAGSLEMSRGGDHVNHDNSTLLGEFDVFGAFSPADWAQASAAGTAWQGGVWRGRRMAGDGWTGSSWASKTWAGATWSGGPWGGPTWVDDTWSGHYWAGSAWSGHYWVGHYWASDNWESTSWS